MKAPLLARLLIRLAAPSSRREDALGDLEEAHRARRTSGATAAWCRSLVDAAIIAAAFVWHRLAPSPGRPPQYFVTFADLRLGVRLLVRQPLTAVTTIVALTAGIGLATVGFATMEAMLFSQLPFDGGDRFVRIEALAQRDRTPVRLEAASYARLTSLPSLAHVGAATGGRESVALPTGSVEELSLTAMTPSSFAFLAAAPLSGRLLTSQDAVPGAPRVALLSEAVWRRTLNGAPAVGATIDVAGTAHTVVGVMPSAFGFPNSPDVWLPLDERFQHGDAVPDGDARLFGVRVPGSSMEQLTTQLNGVSSQVRPLRGNETVSLEARSYTDLGEIAPVLATVIVIAVCAVLIVIAANVGNLILARSFARSREFALRAALGASRARLVAQVMTEVLVLGTIAALVGSLSAQVVLRRFNTMDEIPYWVDFAGGPITAGLVAAVTLLASAIAGAWPAMKATRRDVLQGLQAGDGRSSDVKFGRLSGAIVVSQIAVSVVMLHGALVVAQAFRDYTDVQLDLPANVLTMGVGVNAVRAAADGSRRAPLTAGDVERIVALVPGVISVGAATALPRHSPSLSLVEVEALPGTRTVPAMLAPSAAVSASFFDALGTSVRAGRSFAENDGRPGAPPVAIVNEPFARDAFGGAPLGRRFRVVTDNAAGPWREVVGVVPDLGLSVGDPALSGGYYVPLTVDTNVVFLAMRVKGEPLRYSEPVRRALRERDPDLVPYRAERLEDVNLDDRAFFANFSTVLVGLGVVTLVLALAGVYSMMSLIVSRRTREIGIRTALGARSGQVITAIGGRAAAQIGAGGVIGAALALASLEGRSLLVSRLGDGGAWTLPLVMGVLMAAGLVATWVPLRRALRIRPQDALRAD